MQNGCHIKVPYVTCGWFIVLYYIGIASHHIQFCWKFSDIYHMFYINEDTYTPTVKVITSAPFSLILFFFLLVYFSFVSNLSTFECEWNWIEHCLTFVAIFFLYLYVFVSFQLFELIWKQCFEFRIVFVNLQYWTNA